MYLLKDGFTIWKKMVLSFDKLTSARIYLLYTLYHKGRKRTKIYEIKRFKKVNVQRDKPAPNQPNTNLGKFWIGDTSDLLGVDNSHQQGTKTLVWLEETLANEDAA